MACFVCVQVFDKDEDGFVTAAELRVVMSCLGETLTDQELTALVDAADKDGDGRISFADFTDYIQREMHNVAVR